MATPNLLMGEVLKHSARLHSIEVAEVIQESWQRSVTPVRSQDVKDRGNRFIPTGQADPRPGITRSVPKRDLDCHLQQSQGCERGRKAGTPEALCRLRPTPFLRPRQE